MSGSGISLAICKSAPCSRQITTPASHHSVSYRPDALPVAQPTASKHWRSLKIQKKFHYFPGHVRIQYICNYRNLFRRIIWKTAWDREECMFADVTPDVRTLLPCWMRRNTSSMRWISSSLRPTIWTCCLASSNTRSFCLLFSRSNTCNTNRDNAMHGWRCGIVVSIVQGYPTSGPVSTGMGDHL